jgi:hypothetical protein
MLRTACLLAVFAGTAAAGQIAAPEVKAIAFLAVEVPRWRAEHPCYSCHNNGDAARALISAAKRGHDVNAPLADTLAWLRAPRRWNEKMPLGGIDDKPLARIQFASALSMAVEAGLTDRAPLLEAVDFMAADQQSDGSWQLDSSQSLGSPTTYGTPLATASALRTLRVAGADRFAPVAARAESWLRGVKVNTVVDAAAVILGLTQPADAGGLAQQARALAIIRAGEAPSGGWGPFITSPPQVFDTALVMLALSELPADDQRGASIARGRAFLLAQQNDDGSWPETTRPANQDSYAQRISTTGWALLALLQSDRGTR